MSQLEKRLSESARPASTETLESLLSRCDQGEQRQRQASDCLHTLTGRVDLLDQITRELTEKQENILTLPSPPPEHQDSSPVQEEEQDTTSTTTATVLESKDDIESLKTFVSERVAGMKDLVSGPLSVIFDAIRSDDFVGEDNFLTFSKAAVYLMFDNSITDPHTST